MAKSSTSESVKIGNLGSTGRSTGAHLHLGVEVQRPGETAFKWVNPNDIKSQLKNFGTVGADGRFIPLTVESEPGKFQWNSDFRITSPYGPRSGRDHRGIDIVGEAFPTQGLPWHVKRAPNIVGFGTGVDDPGGYGNNAYVTTKGDDGSTYRFIKAHLESAPNSWTNPDFGQTATNPQTPAGTTQTPATTQQPQVAGTTLNMNIDLGSLFKKKEANFANTYVASMLQGLMKQPDYISQVMDADFFS